MSDEAVSGTWGERAQMAADMLAMKPTRGIPQWLLNIMDIGLLEELAGAKPGDYAREPERVYLEMQHRIGTCWIDQFIPTNPLSMTEKGYDSGTKRGATTGMEEIRADGILIDSPEAVAEHMERFALPALERAIASFDPDDATEIDKLIAGERAVQAQFGPDILKSPYGGFQRMPGLRYGGYGYVNYFMAYALFPELMEEDFRLQGDLAALCNARSAKAIVKGGLPKVVRLDHDMADSRGTLVDIRSLDEIWFPHFARAIRPLLDAGVRLLWHCDGNLMAMVPRLIEAGVGGFQGFQYEDGMDYEAICRMTDRNGGPLMIWAGVSVTRTLPMGTADDVVREMKWLVEHGPRVGLALGGSSSIAPATNRKNVRTLIEGMNHYRVHGRG